jgi:hypothetical protein
VRRALLAAVVAPAVLGAQNVVVRAGAAGGRGAALIDSVAARPHVVLRGSARLDLPRDSTITTSLIVLGRPTYVASRVQGDLVVVGADLFLRPGVEISGRAIAIGGTVAQTMLGHVAGEVVSLRDETFDIGIDGNGYALTPRSLRAEDDRPVPVFQLGGICGVPQLPICGLGIPSYDRVDGLSLPVLGLVTLPAGPVALEPSIRYRSRLGTLDPAVELHVGDWTRIELVGRVARDTRSNDEWIYSDWVSSLLSLSVGTDPRNYFRSDIGEARVVANVGNEAVQLRPFVGGRYERVHPISSTGTVFSFLGRTSEEHMARPNPLVEEGEIGSALAGAELEAAVGVVKGVARAELEQSLRAPRSSHFTQLTVHGDVDFPTFGRQSLHVGAHGVATRGDSVPMARYAYLGGSGTLPLLELLELGGTELLYVESRYRIPIEQIVLPLVGSPVLTLRHLMGGASVGSLGEFQQEVGAGIGVSVLHLDYTVGAGGRAGHRLGVGISLGQ